MAELKPCPFCGSEADTYEYEADQNIYDPITLGYVDTETVTKYGCGCPVCGAMVAEQKSKEKAIEAWNTRFADNGKTIPQKLNHNSLCETETYKVGD